MSGRLDWAKRAITAEDELKSARAKVAALEDHLAAFVRRGNDPMLVTRAEMAESLLAEAVRLLERSRINLGSRSGWMTRARAQLHAVEIFRRDGL